MFRKSGTQAARWIAVGIILNCTFPTPMVLAGTTPPPPSDSPTKDTTHDTGEVLTMAIAIAKANRNNTTLVQRRLQQELSEITYSDAWRKMWVPSVSLGANTGAAYTLAQTPGSADAAAGGGSLAHGTPTANVNLTMGAYTIYNFGKDRDTLKAAELDLERSRENVHETERSVRFAVITAVFNFKTQQDLLDAAQRSVESSEAVYELVKSRIPLGRATQSDLSSTDIDLLNARNLLIQNQTSYSQSLWALNLVLGDPIGQRYRIKTEVKFIKFRMSLDDVLAVYRANAPALKIAVQALEKSRIALRTAEKNALPLPTVSFSGINFGYNITPTGTAPSRDPGNLNFALALTVTLPIVGDGGFLYGHTLRQAEIATEQAELGLRDTANTNEVNVRTTFAQLLQAEASVELKQSIFTQSSGVFEASLGALQSKTAFNRLDIKNALEQLRNAEQDFTNSILTHYSTKLALATLIGVDRFPEENL